MQPDQLKYSDTHEWTAIEGDTATIGISDFAVEMLTDLTFVDLKNVGFKVLKGDVFGEVESVKNVSDLYSPFSGEIIARNERLIDHKDANGKPVAAELDLLSTSPFGDGWLIKIRLSNPAEAAALMNHTQYKEFCRTAG